MTGPTALGTAWTELVSTALLGTDRRPVLPSPVPRLERFGLGDDPARALLDRAAAVQAARRAGAVPGAAADRLQPAPDDDRPPCPAATARRLGSVLRGQHPELLTELLDAIVRRGCALPPEYLVSLMDRSHSDPELRRVVLTAAGPIVPWMAGVLPRLGWPGAPVAGGEGPLEVWERGTHTERLDVLRRLRVTDPALSRELLAGALAKERADHRAALVAVLALGTEADDEALLELALDDRSGQVRDVAAAVLARLPTSAWAGRMAERAREMVRLGTTRGQDALDVRLVAPVPPGWERDGITPAAPAGSSVGVHVLHQVVAGTPLDVWSALGPPSHLVALASEHELGSVLLGAWGVAAARQRDRTWARLLVAETHEPALVAVLSTDDIAELSLRRAEPDHLLTPLTLTALHALPVPWSAEMRRRVAGALVSLFVDHRAGRHQAPLLSRVVRVADPGVLLPLAAALGRLDLAPPIDGVRDDVVVLARFRAEMLDELARQVPR